MEAFPYKCFDNLTLAWWETFRWKAHKMCLVVPFFMTFKVSLKLLVSLRNYYQKIFIQFSLLLFLHFF